MDRVANREPQALNPKPYTLNLKPEFGLSWVAHTIGAY